MSDVEKQRTPMWFVDVKKDIGLQIKAFRREDGSRFILLIGRGRCSEGEWVDDTQLYFLGVDRSEELIKALQEAVASIRD